MLILIIAISGFEGFWRVAAQTSSSPASANLPGSTEYPLRLERLTITGGAELLTIFGTLPSVAPSRDSHLTGMSSDDIPLVSILRDTLGDADPTNDRLRDVWVHTYTRPSLRQRLLAAVPFLYSNRLSRGEASSGVPPALLDLSQADEDVWNRFIWIALQTIFVDTQGVLVKAPTYTYRRNVTDYRKAHLIRALAVLSLYEIARREHQAVTRAPDTPPPALSDLELSEIGGRLALAEETFGGIIDDMNLARVYAKQSSTSNDARGHNWELLRQQAELNDLYFEPLLMPDGSATHAMLWVAAEDLSVNKDRVWRGRFLNIENPWRDRKLAGWRGHTEMWGFDENGARTSSGVAADASHPATGSTRRMIPLALYGLDHPKIPMLLVDFRDNLNPKKREMSRRAIQDVTRNVLAVGRFGNLYYFLGRSIFDFVAGRRAVDINQPSRLRAYSQMKLLLSLDASLDPALHNELNARLESISTNPMERDAAREAEVARKQYAALVAYAQRPSGLPARLARDRRAEMTEFTTSRTKRVFARVAHETTFGLYTHRPRSTPERLARLDIERQLDYHTRFLREVAKSSAVIEVKWNMDDVRRSLEFVAANGETADMRAAGAVARIFSHTEDDSARALSLRCLYRINQPAAKNLLLHIEADDALSARWREMSRDLLRAAVREEQQFTEKDLPRAQSLM